MTAQADKQKAEAVHCITPRRALSRQPKWRKIVTMSPLSVTAHCLLLVKCAAADQQPETTVQTVCRRHCRATDPLLLSTTAPIALGSFVSELPPGVSMEHT